MARVNSGPAAQSFATRLFRDLRRNRSVYLMMLLVMAYYLIFCYQPMYGAQIAFRDYSPKLGIWGSPWVGLKHFREFFGSVYFVRLLRNTFLLNFYNLLFGFPAPIILALLLNEVQLPWFKRTIQTVSYLPHFISTIVICGIILNFCATEGLLSQVMVFFGFSGQSWMNNPDFFRPMYVTTDIWQGVGWGSIIYLAALTGINTELYEAARVDGAGRFKQLWHITLPGISPTIVIMLILRIGNMLNLGYEKVILLYNPGIYETADIISSFVYRKGLLDMSYSYSTAVGLFNSAVNMILLVSANRISRALTDNSLW